MFGDIMDLCTKCKRCGSISNFSDISCYCKLLNRTVPIGKGYNCIYY